MTGPGGRTARSEFGYSPIKPWSPLDDRLDDRGLPRKLAIGEPGWGRFAPRIRILLHAREVKRCIAFDVGKRRVICQRVDDAGRIFVDPKTDKVAVETLTGSVKVEWR